MKAHATSFSVAVALALGVALGTDTAGATTLAIPALEGLDGGGSSRTAIVQKDSSQEREDNARFQMLTLPNRPSLDPGSR